MKLVKWIGVAILLYAGIVTAFESLLGYFQPSNVQTLVISTQDEDGQSSARVVSRLESSGSLYVAANHWPRAWYRRALANPRVEVTIGETTQPYVAARVDDEEHDRVAADHPLPIVFRVLTGFPPRYFLRLDPA